MLKLLVIYGEILLRHWTISQLLFTKWFYHLLMCVCVWVSVSCSVVSDSLWPHGLWPTRLLCPWSSPGKNTGVDSHSLLQGVFPIQGLNLISCITDRLLPKPVITLRITKWWNFNVFISSTFVSWHSYVKMSFCFFPLSFFLSFPPPLFGIIVVLWVSFSFSIL